MPNDPEIVTFGCRLNAYESDVMRKHALAAGLEDAVIVNTCAVTAEAERQARQSIRKIRRERPEARIIVTGCASQIDREKFSAMPEVDHIVTNDRKMELAAFSELNVSHSASIGVPLPLREGSGEGFSPHKQESVLLEPTPHQQKLRLAEEGKPKFLQPPPQGGRTQQQDVPRMPREGGLQRAFVQVQNGCDHRCTFCIIPYGRGASRSMTSEVIADEVRARVEEGYREVVFTGVDIASYGGDLPGQPRLGTMIREVLAQVPELPRLRLSSLDPAAVDEDLWRLIAEEPRLMPHLHLSIQAGDDLILKRMKRRHLRGDVIELCRRARDLRPDIAFGADFIAGFPTETEEMFRNTFNLADECGITWLHVFPYSSRTGTPAAKMPQVNGELRKERAEQLRALGTKTAARHHEALRGQRFDVLVEQQGLGCTQQFAKVKLLGDASNGEILTASCVGCEDGQAIARVLSEPLHGALV